MIVAAAAVYEYKELYLIEDRQTNQPLSDLAVNTVEGEYADIPGEVVQSTEAVYFYADVSALDPGTNSGSTLDQNLPGGQDFTSMQTNY